MNELMTRPTWMVAAALLPAGVAGAVIFGPGALWVILLAVISAVVTEAAFQLIARQRVTIYDGSAVVTGILTAYILPAHVPFWLPVAGAAFAIAIGKQAFGGLGKNVFNPALTGRVFLSLAWPGYLGVFTRPFNYDAISQATPLAFMKHGQAFRNVSYLDLFIGNRGGCIGEVCIAAVLAGALFLLIRGYISWHIPVSFIVTVGVFTWVFGPGGLFGGDWIFHIFSGGLFLGAFFMATDYFTSPATSRGKIIYGVGCGSLTAVMRLWGSSPEGVSYAILIMNGVTPFINRRR